MSFCACLGRRRRERPLEEEPAINSSTSNNGQISNGISLATSSSTTTSHQQQRQHSGQLEEDKNVSTSSKRVINPRFRVFGSFLKRPKRKNAPKRETTESKKALPLPNVPNSMDGKVPNKKVSFSWNHSSHRHAHDFEFIDEEGEKAKAREDEVDADGYSKLEDNQSHRYDYPSFMASRRQKKLTATADDQLYASASQTYSVGSEDPYSSIISMGDRDEESSGIYEPGYSRIKNRPFWLANLRSRPEDQSKIEMDALYAKIDRHPSLPLKSNPNQPSTSAAHDNNNRTLPKRIVTISNGLLQQEESGSGSITSGSREPSYRYLTVRESPRTIRERIRQREEAGMLNELGTGNNENVALASASGSRAEHFYSEITNEYESVGGESVYGGSTRLENSTNEDQAATNEANHRLNGSLSIDTLRVLLSPNPNFEPPHPPTSPIPRPQPPPVHQPPPLPTIRRPIIVKGPPSESPAHCQPSSRKPPINGHRSPTKDFQRHMRSVLQPIWHNSSMLLIGANGRREQRQLGDGVKMANGMERRGLAEVETQTIELPASRIPVPVSARVPSTSLLRRTQSPTMDVAVQTNGFSNSKDGGGQQKMAKCNVKSGVPAPLPAQVGKDYVSPIDLGNRRAWPLTLNSMSMSSLEEE